jgi:hypothetical protein
MTWARLMRGAPNRARLEANLTDTPLDTRTPLLTDNSAFHRLAP